MKKMPIIFRYVEQLSTFVYLFARKLAKGKQGKNGIKIASAGAEIAGRLGNFS